MKINLFRRDSSFPKTLLELIVGDIWKDEIGFGLEYTDGYQVVKM